MTAALRLGLRLSLPRTYVAVVRNVSVALVCAFGVAFGLFLAASQSVVAEQQAVEDARTPVEYAARASAPILTTEFHHEWGGHRLTRVLISTRSTGARGIHPPGIEANPGPGQVYISPAVQELRNETPALRAALREADVVGAITHAGLRDPHELRIIQGVPPSSVMTGASSWGAKDRPLVDLSGPLMLFMPLVLTMCLVPLALALLLSTRLLASETERRSALLKSIGLTRWQVRAVTATELLPTAVVGAAAGWIFFASVRATATGVPGTDFRFWAAQTAIPPTASIVVPVFVVMMAVAIATTAALRASGRSVRAEVPPRKARWWWALPFLVGLAGVVLASTQDVRAHPEATNYMIMGAGVALLGLPLMLRLLTQLTASALHRLARTGATLLAARWVGNLNSATTRLSVAVGSGIFAVAAAAPFTAFLSGPTDLAETQLKQSNGYNMVLTGANITRDELDALAVTESVLEVVHFGGPSGSEASAVLASCEELRALVRLESPCSEPAWINVYGGPIDGYLPDISYPVAIPSLGTAISRPPDTSVVAALDPQLQAAVLVGSSDNAQPTGASDFVVNVADGEQSREVLEGELAAVSPTARYQNAYADWITQANAYGGYLDFLRLSGFVGVLGLLVGLLAALTRTVMERRSAVQTMQTIGVTARLRTSVHLLSQFIPLLVTLVSSALAAACVWVCAEHLYARASMSATAYLWLLGLPVAVAATLAAVTLPASAASRRKSMTTG